MPHTSLESLVGPQKGLGSAEVGGNDQDQVRGLGTHPQLAPRRALGHVPHLEACLAAGPEMLWPLQSSAQAGPVATPETVPRSSSQNTAEQQTPLFSDLEVRDT